MLALAFGSSTACITIPHCLLLLDDFGLFRWRWEWPCRQRPFLSLKCGVMNMRDYENWSIAVLRWLGADGMMRRGSGDKCTTVIESSRIRVVTCFKC